MRQKINLGFLFSLCMAVLFLPVCKTSDDIQFSLTVSVGTGVTGTPVSGTYSYIEGASVNYSYSLESGYTNLVVTLDGTPVSASGTITVSDHHNLSAIWETEPLFDIRGKWTGWLYWHPFWLPGVIYDGFLTVTFEGGLNSGTVTGNMDFAQGWSAGTYTVEGNQVKFNMEYYWGYGVCYFGGTIENDKLMRGWWETADDLQWRREGWKLERD